MLGLQAQLLDSGQQFIHHKLTLGEIVAGVQGAEFYRNAIGLFDLLIGVYGFAYFIYGFAVGAQILLGIAVSAGAFAQHIERESGALVVLFGSALDAFSNGSAQDILAAHNLHGLHNGGANYWLAHGGGQALEPAVGMQGDLGIQADQLAG